MSEIAVEACVIADVKSSLIPDRTVESFNIYDEGQTFDWVAQDIKAVDSVFD